ncbi:type II toxin-antitoxin system HipA family toxin [Rhodopseudomonas palustris]|uniref:Type II toxin-antitoxin system HipA family toxin n=1 Tax=Rhodopseudomonas palustris TaxID=1076 RepID=A0A323UD23_RHOPL|nr:type II toxin-antitoxin system HipA family toxin [Rhodopseudomonas palustris]PZA10762.1 type II toxin-antitoxin system HipA family toxin [Rhodopseudomonas palustris]
MARKRTHVPLNVFLNGRLVGVLRRESTGATDFQYARGWLDWENTFPVSLSLPLREDRYIGAPVINVFDNLLPDSDAIRKRVAERVGADGIDAYSLLAALGHDCVGALQFLPDGVDPGSPGAIDGTPVSNDEVATLINNLASAPLGMGEDEDFRISIAGAQEKTALLRVNGRWLKPSGTAATTHILKPQIGQLPNGVDLSNSVENEYLCLKLLAALGVPTTNTEIADFGGRRTLVVERFDRRWTKDGRLLRLPQEDMCQALSVPPTRKYQSDGGPGIRDIVELLKGSDKPDEDIATFMRACILFWMLGATDGHAKNISIAISPGGRFRLTPLYDVLTAQPSLDDGQIQQKAFKLAMSVGKNRHYLVNEIVPRHFMQTAALAGVGAELMRSLFEDLAGRAVATTDAALAALPTGFPEQVAASVRAAVLARARLLFEFAATQASR